MAEGDVEVELKDDEKPPVDGAAPPAAGAVPAGDPPPDAISDDIAALRRQLDESERNRIAAEQRANTAMQRVVQVEKGATDDRLSMITTALDTIDANLSLLETQMADAMAAGDFATHAKLNRQMTEQAAQKPDLLRGKAALEHAAKNPRPVQPQPGEMTDTQKIDAYVSTMQPRAAAWVRAHPQFVLDTKLNDKLLARHFSAREAGHVEGTDGYFRFIEDGLGLPQGNGHAAPAPIPSAAEGGGADPLSAAGASVRKRDDVQPPAAPPSRGGGGARKLTLTKAEQEAATMSGLSFEDYARNKERELKAGNIGKGRLN